MALIDRAAIGGKGGARDCVGNPKALHQGFRHGADISGIGRIEGRAIFEEDLSCTSAEQRIAGGERPLDRLGGGICAGFHRDDDGIGIRKPDIRQGHTNRLHDMHTFPCQHERNIGCARQIISDYTKQHETIPAILHQKRRVIRQFGWSRAVAARSRA